MNHYVDAVAPWLIAVVIASCCSWVDISETPVGGGRRKLLSKIGARPVAPRFLSWRMTHIILLRMLFDWVLGATAYYFITRPMLGKPHAYVALLAGAMGGLIGPEVARSEILPNDAVRVSISNRYRGLVGKVDRLIANVSATEQTDWFDQVVVPTLGTMPVDQLLMLLCTYADNMGQQQVIVKSDELKAQLRQTTEDRETSEDLIKRTLLQQTLDAGGLRFLRREVRRRRRSQSSHTRT
jgi:hypothetical protein